MEMAVTIPTLILVLLAILEVVVVARIQLELVAAAREGARVAATAPSPEAAVDAAIAALSPELGQRANVSVVRPAVVGRQAIVTLTLRHRLTTPIMKWATVDLHGRAVMRVEK
ncbi:MAG: TadE/TadG family type IV pilus assembly protein [Acidimicrobiia bacterium]